MPCRAVYAALALALLCYSPASAGPVAVRRAQDSLVVPYSAEGRTVTATEERTEDGVVYIYTEYSDGSNSKEAKDPGALIGSLFGITSHAPQRSAPAAAVVGAVWLTCALLLA